MAKWYREIGNEKWVEIAYKLRELYIQKAVELVVPDLIIYELGNFFRYKGNLSEEEASIALQSFFDLEIRILPPIRLIAEQAMKIAFENTLSYYDAYFISFSQNIDFHFVTADEKLFEKISSLYNVHLLGEIEGRGFIL